ncbi:MAG: asparagine synthase (glutamine-hydrolyzing) [Candidatus Riflebacteria bacterium]|nr:asparagine synthase (glutamine-hydrolyzing) [Candidatus Riflebacteria bacterium]
MCGIFGVLAPELAVDESLLLAMQQSLTHRGPDDRGLYRDAAGDVALGHCRLAILDLTAAGHQPMSSPDGRFVIVFNGEIYNYLELRRELEARGERFSGHSDTDVLLRAYQVWGPPCLDKLLGMFAFAVWDREDGHLFLARDRAGKKPLVYYWDGARFAFASELKALLEVPGCEPVLDPACVELFLALGYVPAPGAIFRNLRKLEAGHFLRVRAGTLELQRYWRPESAVQSEPSPTPRARLSTFRALFSRAVSLRLRSDVPIGIFLSGGLDSSLIAHEVCRQGYDLHALTVAFAQDRTDLPSALEVARRLGLRHDTIEVGDEVASGLGDVLSCYDEPFADTSSIPSYAIARAGRPYFKVVLNGDGGDEALAGYPHFAWIAWKQRLKQLGCALGVRDGSPSDPWDVYFQSKALFRRRARQALLAGVGGQCDPFGEWIASNAYLRAARDRGPLRRALWADRHVYLPNDLLYKMDLALGAFGMEGRSPFLDHTLLEWAQELPENELVDGDVLKVLLRRACRGLFSDELVDRPKHGFGAPAARWLQGPLREQALEVLPTPLLATEPQRRILDAFYDRADLREATRLWSLFTFALWAARWRARWA